MALRRVLDLIPSRKIEIIQQIKHSIVFLLLIYSFFMYILHEDQIYMKTNLNDKLDFGLDKAPSCWIKRTNSINLLAFGLDKGQVLHKHKALYPTVVTVLEGKVEFEFDKQKLILNKNETLDLPENESHEVIGLERSIFTLLQIKN